MNSIYTHETKMYACNSKSTEHTEPREYLKLVTENKWKMKVTPHINYIQIVHVAYLLQYFILSASELLTDYSFLGMEHSLRPLQTS